VADSEEERKEVARLYAAMTDAELKKLADEAWSLTATGKEALQAELARRGLEVAMAEGTHPEPPTRDPVTLCRFRDMPEALLAKGALESAGIESFLIDETTIRMDWLWSNALGGIKLCVKPEDAEAAAQLLQQEIPEKFSVEGLGDFQQPRCPQCQSLNISYEDMDKRIAYAGMLFLGFPISVKHIRWKCQACGYEWQPNNRSEQNP
jgi:hypothetical protein